MKQSNDVLVIHTSSPSSNTDTDFSLSSSAKIKQDTSFSESRHRWVNLLMIHSFVRSLAGPSEPSYPGTWKKTQNQSSRFQVQSLEASYSSQKWHENVAATRIALLFMRYVWFLHNLPRFATIWRKGSVHFPTEVNQIERKCDPLQLLVSDGIPYKDILVMN